MARDMARSWCQKKSDIEDGSKICFARISFKPTLYKNRSGRNLQMPGGTVSVFRVFLDISAHAYLVSGPFLTVSVTFSGHFMGRFGHLLDHFGVILVSLWMFLPLRSHRLGIVLR